MDENKLKALAAELAKGLKTEADLNQFSRMLTKLTVETALNAELTDHLGHEKNAPKKGSNTRNGYSSKTLLCDDGEIELNTPRDRENTFEPQLIKKNQTRITQMDSQILSLYAKGMTTREIVATFKEMYDADAAETDKRFKSIATISMFNSGLVRRNGMQDSQLDTIQQRLQQASEARAQEAAGGEVLYSGDANLTDEQIAKLPFALYRQGYEYYWKTHAHPNSTFKYTTSSLLDLMSFDVTDHINLINKPLLMIAGTKADTLYMTEDAFAKATGTKDKELFLIDGATHIETYWAPKYVDQAMQKLDVFFDKNI